MASGQEEVKMAVNKTCDFCQKNHAEVFCACTKTRIYLCGVCTIEHTRKKPHLVHQLIRADIDVSNLSTYRERSESYAAGSAELEKNLIRIDQCSQEVTTAFNTVIELLGQWRDYYVRSLQEWKVTLYREVAEAEDEVKDSLAQDNVQLSGKYSPLLRCYQSGPLQLFTYEINTSGFDDLARNAVKFQYIETPKPESFEALTNLPQTHVSTSPPLPHTRKKPASLPQQDSEKEAARLKGLAKSKLTSGNNAEAIELCSAADAIYALLPHTIDKAINLTNWGNALNNMERSEEAVAKHAAADAIYSRLFPDDVSNATNLANWGLALTNMGKNVEAVAKCAAADAIYSRLFPDNIGNATNLNCWGLALSSIGKTAEAVTKHAAADAIYSSLFPNHIGRATNLTNWGLALNSMGKSAKAVAKYAAANALYSRLFPNDDSNATNLTNWGSALKTMGKNAEAVAKFAAADVIYSRLFPDNIGNATNLHNWGIVLKTLGKNEEAVRKFEAARLIYTSMGRTDSVSSCDREIAKLR